MFIQNKYSTWYFNLVEKAKQRSKPTEYTEVHHIIPKSMGGTNAKNNLITLTCKEHFIAHLLLTKITDGINLHKAFCALSVLIKTRNNTKDYKNSRLYEAAKKYTALHASAQMKQMHANGRVKRDRYEKARLSHSKLIWVNNGVENKRVRSDVEGLLDNHLAEGWVRGRTRDYLTAKVIEGARQRANQSQFWQHQKRFS